MVAFALMKMPALLNAAYERRPVVQRNWDELRQLRQAFRGVDPTAYRGIERFPLSEIPESFAGSDEVTTSSSSIVDDAEARRRLIEILGDHECDHYPCSMVETFAQAHELMLLMDHPEEYEVVRLSRGDSGKGALFGFDVGYWGGGNYSILCDSVIWPMWHGPVPAAFNDLSHHVACLNSHMLFPDHDSAERFRSFYVTQAWAETEDEPAEFCVIRVEPAE
jgi:hypothetical protein